MERRTTKKQIIESLNIYIDFLYSLGEVDNLQVQRIAHVINSTIVLSERKEDLSIMLMYVIRLAREKYHKTYEDLGTHDIEILKDTLRRI